MFNFLKRKKESNFEGLSMADMQQGCTIYMNYHDGIGISTSHFYYPPTFTNPMRPEIIKKTLNHFIKLNGLLSDFLLIGQVKTFQEQITTHIKEEDIKLAFFLKLNKDLKKIVLELENENLSKEKLREEIEKIISLL